MLSKFLDPKNDVAFKKIFGSTKNKDILIHFLNDMLVFREKKPIVGISFLKPIQDPETAAKKTSMVDILCEDTAGNHYIVEMEVAKEKGFEKRAQYYAAKAYISQMNMGGKYHDLKEVIFLAITNFTMFPNKEAFKSDHIIFDKDNHHHDLQDFSFTFIELEKFNKTIEELSSIVDKWAYFFKHAEETTEQELPQVIGNDTVIQRAYEELNRFSWNDTEMLTYNQSQKYEWDHQAMLEQKYDEGIEKGQIQAKRDMANAMILQGIDKKIIAQVTGLSDL